MTQHMSPERELSIDSFIYKLGKRSPGGKDVQGHVASQTQMASLGYINVGNQYVLKKK